MSSIVPSSAHSPTAAADLGATERSSLANTRRSSVSEAGAGSSQAAVFLETLARRVLDQAPVKDDSQGPPYITAYIATGPEAGLLSENGLANAFVPEWQAQVQSAWQRNGGGGDAARGYLAWSEKGFVLLNNTGLSPEQNQRFANLSLALGIPVEKLPSRTSGSSNLDRGLNEKLERFLADYDSQLQTFLADPRQKIHLRDGKRRFDLVFHSESGAVTSVTYKKSSWKHFGSSVLSAAAHVLRLAEPASFLLNIAQRKLQGVPLLGELTALAAARTSGHFFPQIASYFDGLANSDFSGREFTALTAAHAANGISSLPTVTPGQMVLQNISSNLLASVVERAGNTENNNSLE